MGVVQGFYFPFPTMTGTPYQVVTVHILPTTEDIYPGYTFPSLGKQLQGLCMFPSDPFEMELEPKLCLLPGEDTQRWKISHIVKQMRTLLTLIFKKKAEGKHAV